MAILSKYKSRDFCLYIQLKDSFLLPYFFRSSPLLLSTMSSSTAEPCPDFDETLVLQALQMTVASDTQRECIDAVLGVLTARQILLLRTLYDVSSFVLLLLIICIFLIL